MKQALIVIVAVIAGAFGARAIWFNESEKVDPLNVIVTQLRTHAIIEHERQVVVWYRACPDVRGIDPQIFIAWPAKLSYELDLDDVTLERKGNVIEVRTPPIRGDEPAVPSDFLDYLSTNSLFTFANEQKLVNEEIAKSSALARYLTAYFLLRDASLHADFADELKSLVARMAGALEVGPVTVDVKIEQPRIRPPKLPKIELCDGSAASVNGQPFARLEDGYIIPIRFEPLGSGRAAGGIASVLGTTRK